MPNDIPRYWKPLRELAPHETYRRPEVTAETAKAYGISLAEADAMLDVELAKCRLYTNHLYQVQVMPCGPDGSMLHICIRRIDGACDVRDWRHFQQIKNEIAGPEFEAFELYPAESRKVDTSNKWHLWVLPPGERFDTIGWQQRDVQYDSNDDVPGLRQRAL